MSSVLRSLKERKKTKASESRRVGGRHERAVGRSIGHPSDSSVIRTAIMKRSGSMPP